MDKERIKQKIKELVKRYKDLEDKKGIKGMREISEADVRADFVDELFSALGWNVKNPDEYDREHYIRKVGYADIALKLDKKPVVFVEAKRFGEIEDVIKREGGDWMDDERQVMNYALRKRIKWAVLTNFEKLRVFNAFNGFTILDIKAYWEYEDRLEDLIYLSKEYVESGQINKLERREEREDIDLGFLQSLNNWRLRLANDIYRNNKDNTVLLDTDKNLDLEKLKSSVQRILDRLIIIRYAEDRLILDNPDQLKSLYEAWQSTKTYTSLVDAAMGYFRGFDKIYDGKIFEKGHVCEKVKISDNVVGEIISDLYKINFRKFDFDILGNTYETYLGNTLHLKEDGTLVLKPSQETRKEAGIYYTPPYVVDYIVKNTLGELLKNKTAEEIKKIKVLDPACGSGSFLIKAFDYFKDYYEKENERIRKQREEKIRKYMKSGKNQLRLDLDALKIEELKGFEQQILKNNIFGVDLDRQAAEIASVNLMLKALKPKEKLPLILEENIKVGNSLISGTEEELAKHFGANWKQKRPFNWEDEFPKIFKDGGFDVVIGNPPYGAKLSDKERKYISINYEASRSYKNTALMFIERSLDLLKEGSYFGMIVPKSLAFSQKWNTGRKLIKNYVYKIVDVSKAFEDVLLEQIIIILKLIEGERKYKIESIDFPEKIKMEVKNRYIDKTDSLIVHPDPWDFQIFEKMNNDCIYLGEISKTSRGLPFQKYVTKKKSVHKIWRGKNISRYFLHESNEYIENAKINENDKKVRFLKQPKIISQRIVAHVTRPKDHIIIMSTIDRMGILTLDTVENTILTNSEYSLEFLLCLLNSKLISWYSYRYIFAKAIRTMDLDAYYLGKIPIPAKQIDMSSFSSLAERMLSLNKQLNEIKPKTEFKRYVEDKWRGKIILFKRYVDKLSVADKEILNDSNKRSGKIKEFEVREEGGWLVFKVGYLKETQKGKDMLVTIDALKCRFIDENLHKFLYHCIKEYVRPGKLGKGNRIYDKLLNIKIPRFKANEEENNQVIEEIMTPFLRELKSYMKIKKEIEETDKIIDQKVYELYGLTDEEIKIVEKSVR